jgi:hypothetical protein
MKKYLPFVFPALALVIVVLLALRWYSMRTNDNVNKPNASEGVKIEELSADQLDTLKKTPVADMPTVKLSGPDGAVGEVRYQLLENTVAMTVTAMLPELAPGKGIYQLWIKPQSSATYTKIGTLELGKAGYMADAAFAASRDAFNRSHFRSTPRGVAVSTG